MPAPPQGYRQGNRQGRRQRLNKVAGRLISPALRARGITISRIITEWQNIVGEASAWCEPASIKFPPHKTTNGILTVNVASGRGPDMQMLGDEIIRNVNRIFGYGAIGRIVISQTVLSASPEQQQQRQIDPKIAEDFDRRRQNIDPKMGDNLRQALDNLGKALSGGTDDKPKA